MKRLTEIEVEPLSDQRWSRIERSLMERVEADSNDASKRTVEPRRRLGGRAWLVAAALVGVVGAVTVGIVSMPQRAAVEQPSRITTGTTPSSTDTTGTTSPSVTNPPTSGTYNTTTGSTAGNGRFS